MKPPETVAKSAAVARAIVMIDNSDMALPCEEIAPVFGNDSGPPPAAATGGVGDPDAGTDGVED